MSRATLSDLVEDFLRLQLGYGEEFVVNNEVGLLYDVDETENLSKKLSELGTLVKYLNFHSLTRSYRYQE
jgi:ubiquitin-like 1-activating enzyme E1 B